MGADLYLRSVFEPNREQYQPLFEEWIQRRDALQKAGQEEEAKAAQLEVEEYYDKIYEGGYFRDSYNSSNLLRLFNLSWWADVGNMLDENSEMSSINALALLEMLNEREATFADNLPELDVWEGMTKGEMDAYFQGKYERLKTFLKEAIARNEAIMCSI